MFSPALFKKKIIIKSNQNLAWNYNFQIYMLELSESVAVGELFISKPLVDERHCNNDFFLG